MIDLRPSAGGSDGSGRPSTDGHAARNLAHRRRRANAGRGVGDGDWWVGVVAVSLMVASDYKWRVRDLSQSLHGIKDLSTVLEIVVYGTVAAYLLLGRATPPRLGRTPDLLFLAWLYSILLALSAAYSPYPVLAVVRGLQLLIVCGMAQSFARHARPRAFSLLAHAFVAVVAISIVVGRAVPFPRPAIRANRFTWLAVHPVISGTYMGLAVVLLVAFLRASRARRSPMTFPLLWPTWVYAALLPFTALALLATRTRGAIGACAVGCLLVGLVGIGRKRQMDLLVGLTAAGAAAALAFGPAIVRFVERGQGVARLETFNARSNLWAQAIDLVRRRPFVGYGLTASRGLFFDTTGLGGGHNALINVVTDGGIIGAVAWIALLVGLVVAIFRLPAGSPGYIQRPLLLGVIGFMLVNGVTTEGLGAVANVSNVWLFVLCAWVIVVGRVDGGASGVRSRSRGRASRARSPR